MNKHELNYVVMTSDNKCFLESKDSLETTIMDLLERFDEQDIKIFKLGKEIKFKYKEEHVYSPVEKAKIIIKE